jgi:aspartate aminotransferase
MTSMSSRTKGLGDSITLQLNEKAQLLSEQGQFVYNLSAGQLPLKPPSEFIHHLKEECHFLKSFQYSPVQGFADLRQKILKRFFQERDFIDDQLVTLEHYDVIFSNGSKQSIYIALGALIDPGDEVIVLAPYWVSYPEMIKFWGGVPVVVKTNAFDAFCPDIDDLKKVITPRTKAIILNSPNNPGGVHYPQQMMKSLGQVFKDYPEMWILSDEVYAEITYFDPKPFYFYQEFPELLERTLVFQSLSKMLASTGLRLGWTIAPKNVCRGMSKIQGQSTSGPNSLIQRALMDFDFSKLEDFLKPIKIHLRKNATTLREKLREADLSNLWYQSNSAFYFMLDFARTPCFSQFDLNQLTGEETKIICQEILDECGVLLVPGTDFGLPTCARLSLTLDEVPFTQAITRLIQFLHKARVAK